MCPLPTTLGSFSVPVSFLFDFSTSKFLMTASIIFTQLFEWSRSVDVVPRDMAHRNILVENMSRMFGRFFTNLSNTYKKNCILCRKFRQSPPRRHSQLVSLHSSFEVCAMWIWWLSSEFCWVLCHSCNVWGLEQVEQLKKWKKFSFPEKSQDLLWILNEDKIQAEISKAGRSITLLL